MRLINDRMTIKTLTTLQKLENEQLPRVRTIRVTTVKD